MPLISLVFWLIIIGVLLWLINTKIPMDAAIRTIINVVVILAVVVWLASIFGLANIRVGPVVR